MKLFMGILALIIAGFIAHENVSEHAFGLISAWVIGGAFLLSFHFNLWEKKTNDTE